MSTHYFLFTYDVTPAEDRPHKQADANRLRSAIGRLQEPKWEKNSSVDTAFTGTIELNGLTHEKRIAARKFIKQILRKVSDEYLIDYLDADIDVLLMVDGLGESMEFRV